MSKLSSKPSEFELDVEERETQKFKPEAARRLALRVSRHVGLLLSGMGLILVSTGAQLFQPFWLGYGIDHALRTKDIPFFRIWVFVFLGSEILRYLSNLLHSYLFALLGQLVMQDLRVEVLSHFERLPITVYDKNPVGRLITRVTNDIAALAEMFSSGFASIFANVLVVTGIIVWILVLDTRLALIGLSVFPFLVVAAQILGKRLKVAYREMRSKLSALNAFLAENILGMKTVHLFNRQEQHLERFHRINAWYTDAQVATVRVFALLQPSITWCTGIAMGLIIYFGGGAAYHATIAIGTLVAFYTYVLTLFQPIREIADKWNIFLSGMASADRIFGVLKWKPEIEELKEENLSDPVRGEIEFQNVWFAYEGERWVLKDFNLTIAPGMKIGIVGHTGAGKTTLIQLLLRFYAPQKGRILLDGKDIQEIPYRVLRSYFGMIQQDVFLFSGTLEENATLWRQRAVERIRGTQVPAFLRSYFEGVERDTPVLEERGTNLSMGQRQILAFARAWAMDPSIWVLDEASANLDSESERKLQSALEEATRGKTTFVIAHRLATVRKVDRILVLHQGTLVEQGSHLELLKRNGLYSRLYRYQAALQAPEESQRMDH